ncbi:MAG: hypothetical protein A3K19_15885 [Lentisphaerae bacterium RIFOXYB12_FULL_65_16]|nr:MAG: hypothetical protein A3K18_03305 [Lentisphaerae bacterium RIFOXYA12_64_32]OGV87362.1 MAG: hypothetical protein A3K19_15885 [Lentisphaerae bacterium RIFOXYB12_FULL_65_16]
MQPSKPFAVRAAHCDHRAPEDTVFRTLERITAPLSRSWARLEAARLIAIKVNLVYSPDQIRCVNGRRQELVDDVVLRSALRLLRQRTTARIVCSDTSQLAGGGDVFFKPLLREFGVDYIECNDPPFAVYEPPGGGLMFRRYRLNPVFKQADAVVSIATLKTHAFMGVTLCTKNLFGLPPINPGNRPRTYFHHVIRLPFVLADLARIVQPCLNVIDGLVAQTRREWGGDARITNTLVAGDHVIATDACAATLMGNDPQADWPRPPFRRDRNHLRIAAESGFGTVDLGAIDFQHDLRAPVGEFDSEKTDPDETVESWRRTMCEQALFYRDHRERLLRDYAGQYICLQAGHVIAHGADPIHGMTRRDLAGAHKEQAVWFKYVDPDDFEDERFEVYERELAALAGRSSDGRPRGSVRVCGCASE